MTVEYKLKRKYIKTTCKFPCGQCTKIFTSQREVNEYFRTSHSPVKCNYCKWNFGTLVAMLKHRCIHYEFMYECKYCDKGFHFESQLKEHFRVHQSQGDWGCFKLKCGKHFKRESELNTHLIGHSKVLHECKECDIKNPDPCNLRDHMRVQSDDKSFVCQCCGKGFCWVEQQRRHLQSGECPPPNPQD